MKTVLIDGRQYDSVRAIHAFFAKTFDWPYYGHNTDALWDLLTTAVERPLTIKWINIDASREQPGDEHRTLLNVLRRVEAWDQAHLKASERLHLVME
ncbi:barstar family protein [Taibaiella chishuiensis]|uniref:Ribonuclease inhibitor n=1 Tax=Taibaiella chishuiensis TaxID=1434707 RepID=A0A2P8D7D1_9BACT|nr:barstar family protein [Taibaiella chishuiensis]PSK93097.1 ribonuclease inhibitor [Taibaiella chishuiensis]